VGVVIKMEGFLLDKKLRGGVLKNDPDMSNRIANRSNEGSPGPEKMEKNHCPMLTDKTLPQIRALERKNKEKRHNQL